MAVIKTTDGPLYTLEEASKLLGLTMDSLRRYCNMEKPKIRGRKVGRDWHIPKAEIERYRKERREAGRPAKSA